MLHQFAVRSCFPCVNCFSDENNTLSPTPLHPADPPSLVDGGRGNKSAPEDKTTPNEPLIALLALLLVHYRPADLWSTTAFLARTVIILLRNLYRL